MEYILYHNVFMDWEWKLARSEVIIAHFSWCLLYGKIMEVSLVIFSIVDSIGMSEGQNIEW